MSTMKKINRIRLIAINIFLFAMLFSLITFNKEVLRPVWGFDPTLGVLTGSFPNFIAAFIISLAVVNPVLMLEPKRGRFFVTGGALIVFTVLTVEELRPMWGASTHFDPWDILGSGLGSLCAILTFETINLIRMKMGTKTRPGDDQSAGVQND